MISNELMDKYQVQKVWACSKRDASNTVGFMRAFLGECANGKWLVVISDKPGKASEVLLLNTRPTAMVKIRERGFYSRISKIYSSGFDAKTFEKITLK